MEPLHDYLVADEAVLKHHADMRARYRKLFEAPNDCAPMIIISVPVELPRWEAMLADPGTMLRAQLDQLRPHYDMKDDHVPSVRVNFGTAQPASAYGCRIHVPENSLPAAASHPLTDIKQAYDLEVPALDAGQYAQLHEWTEQWLAALPEGVAIQHPDIQSPFNTAHLVRGNDIFLDIYDDPDALDALLTNITDFMIKLTPYLKSRISNDTEYFYDWSAMWKGTARISNCTMQLLSPEAYTEHVKQHDERFFRAIGGGRLHYCGESRTMAKHFFGIDTIYGYDLKAVYEEAWLDFCNDIPAEKVPLIDAGSRERGACREILEGRTLKKRNIILVAQAQDVEAGKRLLDDLRTALR